MQPCSLHLILKSNTFTIPIRFKHMLDFSLDILNILISSSNHSYYVQSDVCNETFQSFINYLINDQVPEITIDNINEYIELSNEFEILTSEIQSKKEEFGEYLIHINGLRYHRNSDSLPNHEKSIAEQLDFYIEKYGQFLMKIPIQSLYNIFNHPLRKLTKFDDAYDQIKKEFSESNDSSIFVLLKCLDGSQMSRHNIAEMISLKNERNDYMASIDFEFISDLKNDQIKSEIKIKSLEKQIEQLRQIIIDSQKENESKMIEIAKNTIGPIENQFKQNLDEKIEKLEKSIDEINKKFSDENKLLKGENEKMKKCIEQKVDESKMIEIIKKIIHEKIEPIENKFKQNFDELNKKILEKDEKIDKLEKNIDEINKKYSDENKLLKKENEQMKKNIDQIKKDNENAKKEYESSIKKLSDQNQQLKNENKQIKLPGIPILFENNKEFQGIINYLTNKGNIDNEINITNTPLYSNESIDSAKHAILYNSTKYFRTKDVESAFICFDFKDKKIIPTAYTIKTATGNCIRPRSWVIEVSNDNSIFTVIDEQKECQSLNEYNRVQTFHIKERLSDTFRYIKLRQTGRNWYENGKQINILVIGSIEFYGYLV